MKKYKLNTRHIYSNICSLKEQINVLKFLFLVFVLLLPAFFNTPAAADFYENFESGSLSNWVMDGSGIFEVTTSTSVEGTQSFHRYGEITGHDNGMHITFTSIQPFYVSFYIKSGSTSKYDAYFVLKDSSSGTLAYFNTRPGGQLGLVSSTGDFSYNADQWYHIELKNINWSAYTLDFYIDGTLAAGGTSFHSQCTSVNYLSLYSYDADVHSYWDDIQIISTINNPPTDIALSNASINENQSSGITVGTFSTTDPDTGESFTYALVSGTGSTDNTSFVISGSNLETASIFNYESQSSYSIRVRTTDSHSGTYEKAFTITINDLNESPTISTISNQCITENSLTVTVNINDVDTDTLSLAAESSNLTLISNSNLTFSGTGYTRTLTITPTANETGHSTIIVTVSDPDGLTSSTEFVAYVSDVLELPNNVSAKYNEDISIPLTFYNKSDLSIDSIYCEMTYDSNVLTITSASLTGTVLENENYLFEYNMQTPGIIILGLALIDPYTGSGNIANLNFNVIGEAFQSSPLSLSIAEFNEVEVHCLDGSFEVLPNEAPDISNIVDTHSYKNTATSIHFSVTEVESEPCSMTVTTTSSDISVVPNENISVTCNDNDYTITITPAAWQVGSSTISISITDTGGLNSTSSFVFYVDNQDPIAGDGNPAVSSLTITTDEDTPITFVAGYDPDNDPLIINTVIEPLNATITFNSASNIMTYTPNVNYNGTETFVYQVFDGFAYDPYTVTVITNPVNDAPIIGIIPNQVTDEDTATGPIGFTVADADGDNLTLSANSSNITLVAMDRIQFSGTGANRTISITPTANESGTVSITVMVNDSNGLTAITAFLLTVTSVNDSPVISSILDQTIDEDFATSPIVTIHSP